MTLRVNAGGVAVTVQGDAVGKTTRAMDRLMRGTDDGAPPTLVRGEPLPVDDAVEVHGDAALLRGAQNLPAVVDALAGAVPGGGYLAITAPAFADLYGLFGPSLRYVLERSKYDDGPADRCRRGEEGARAALWRGGAGRRRTACASGSLPPPGVHVHAAAARKGPRTTGHRLRKGRGCRP